MSGEALTREQEREPSATPGSDEPEEMPRVVFTRDRIIVFGLFVITAVAFLYFFLPKLAGLHDTWDRIKEGDHWWLAGAAAFEILSFGGYVALFRAVCIRGEESRIDWRESYQITMAGLAATRLFAAAGAGGVALTAWALRRSGMSARIVACRMVAFMVLLYSVYLAALVIVGVLLRTSVLNGGVAFALTVVPAILGGVLILMIGLISLIPGNVERSARRWSHGRGRMAGIAARLATAPASLATGTRTAMDLIRDRNPGVLGAVAWWGFDVATLWACFHAFGSAPAVGVVVMAYFLGMLGNLLPAPGRDRRRRRRHDRCLHRLRGGLPAGHRRRSRVPWLLVLAAHDPGRDRLPPAAPDGQPVGRGTGPRGGLVTPS